MNPITLGKLTKLYDLVKALRTAQRANRTSRETFRLEKAVDEHLTMMAIYEEPAAPAEQKELL